MHIPIMTDTRIIQICPPQRLRKEIIAIMNDFANRYRVYYDANRKNPILPCLTFPEMLTGTILFWIR